MKTISILDLLKSGAHFGHLKAKKYPKMGKYIFGLKHGVHIINLEQTIEELEKAYNYVKGISANGGSILFIGTKRQAKSIVKAAAEKCNMPYVISRWIGGTFTNFDNIIKLPQKMKKLEDDLSAGVYDKHTKKEKLMIEREIIKLKEMVEGIRDLEKIPDAIFVVDIHDERTAVEEANVRNVPIISLVDTNVNPEKVKFPIPANDDSVETIKLISNAIADAVLEGKKDKK